MRRRQQQQQQQLHHQHQHYAERTRNRENIGVFGSWKSLDVHSPTEKVEDEKRSKDKLHRDGSGQKTGAQQQQEQQTQQQFSKQLYRINRRHTRTNSNFRYNKNNITISPNRSRANKRGDSSSSSSSSSSSNSNSNTARIELSPISGMIAASQTTIATAKATITSNSNGAPIIITAAHPSLTIPQKVEEEEDKESLAELEEIYSGDGISTTDLYMSDDQSIIIPNSDHIDIDYSRDQNYEALPMPDSLVLHEDNPLHVPVAHTVDAGVPDLSEGNIPKNLPKSLNPNSNDEDEEDMGYDEDDERIERARAQQRPGNVESGFMSHEGGDDGIAIEDRPEDNEGSGSSKREKNKGPKNKANGNDDDDDNDDNEDDDDENDDDDDDDDGLDSGEGLDRNSQSQLSESNSHYFRKTVRNDAIKIISTPLGKVGIVYQQPSAVDVTHQQHGHSKNSTTAPPPLTDFNALSPDPESSRRLGSSHPKITPVLTADGKVALLYRGDSDSSKYEPIRNISHKFGVTAPGDGSSGSSIIPGISAIGIQSEVGKKKGSSTPVKVKKEDEDSNYDSLYDDDDDDDDDEDNDNDANGNKNNNDKIIGSTKGNTGILKPITDITNTDIDRSPSESLRPVFRDSPAPTGGPFIIRKPTDSVLPMINRPLSEVLGIKKNQFRQFRIKETDAAGSDTDIDKDITTIKMVSSSDSMETAVMPPSLPQPPRMISNGGGIIGSSIIDTPSAASTSESAMHFLAKVNLAEYPTSAVIQSRNRDFDFSRDHTMLDERTRYREHLSQQQQQQSSTSDSVANEQLLAKTEVVNLAIVPHFDAEIERLQRVHEQNNRGSVGDEEGGRRHHQRQRHRHYGKQHSSTQRSEEELSVVHCVMQAMMVVAAISTVFGMLGTFFKQRILDQLRLLHW